jgi:hypothetical protein
MRRRADLRATPPENGGRKLSAAHARLVRVAVSRMFFNDPHGTLPLAVPGKGMFAEGPRRIIIADRAPGATLPPRFFSRPVRIRRIEQSCRYGDRYTNQKASARELLRGHFRSTSLLANLISRGRIKKLFACCSSLVLRRQRCRWVYRYRRRGSLAVSLFPPPSRF